MIEKKYARWRAGTPLSQDFAHLPPESGKKVRRVAYDDIPASDVPKNAIRMDENYADPDAGNRILAWLTDDGTLHYWTDADAIQMTDETRKAFSGLPFAEEIDLGGIDTSQMTDMSRMFNGDFGLKAINLSGFDTSGVTDMAGMFSGCESLESIDLSPLDTSAVKDLSGMFQGCKSLKSLDVLPLDTHSAVSMSMMFEGCASLKRLNLSSFDTSSLEYADYMFFFDTAMKSLDLSSFDMTDVDCDGMFNGCTKLRTVTVSDKWNADIGREGVKFEKKGKRSRLFHREDREK